MLLGKCDRWPVGVGVWLSVPCVVSRLACFLVLRPRRNRTLSRNRKERRQLLRDLHPRHPYLRQLRVGSNRWWRALQSCSAIQPRRAGFRVWSVSPLPLIAMAEL